MPLHGRSITFSISLLFTVLASVVFIVMGYVISVAVNHHFTQQDQETLQGKLELIQNILSEPGSGDHGRLTRKLADALVGHHDLAVLVTQQATPVFTSNNGHFLAQYLKDTHRYSTPDQLLLRDFSDGISRFRGITATLPASGNGTGFRIVIAVDIENHIAFLRMFETMLLLIGLAGILLMAGLGWFATRQGLRPIWDMARIAEGISAQQLRERMTPDAFPLELKPLALSFNAMLDRLEDAMTRLSDYASDIAHELRTPVNNLMLQTQVSLGKSRNADEYREILYSNLEEYERLSHMISDMLFLAKADNGLMIPNREQMDLRGEIDALFEFYDALASEQNVPLRVSGNARISGDRLMMRRAISNLLSNAIRHSPTGAEVAIRIEPAGNDVVISVANHGEPIPPQHIQRIFDRFHRADESRLRTDEGAGLGLAITRSIIEAHQGTVSVTSDATATRFVVRIPASTADQR